MMIDLEPDDIDGLWRDGLARAASTAFADAPARVEARLVHRHRVHRAHQALATMLAVVVAVGVIATLRRSRAVNVGTRAPITKVTVDDGRDGELRISFPGRRAVGNPPAVVLPAGRIRFTVRYYGTHQLVLDGVHAFRAPGPAGSEHTPKTVHSTVTLRPGRYRLHCIIKGHTAAGELAWIVVR